MTISRQDKQIITSEEESFLDRWSRRKQEARENKIQSEGNEIPTAEISEPPLLTDADMPPLESLNEDSDYRGFLSPRVSETLRKQALRKLFGSPSFNIRDGLDDYDGDYTQFEKLGEIITADMRHQMEMETRRRMEQLAEQEMKQETQQTATATTPEGVETTEAETALVEYAPEQTSILVDDEEVEI